MCNNDKKTIHWGFGQLRFVIAIVLLLAAGLKAYQLATVPLPPPVRGSVFTPLLEFLNNRGLLIFVVEAEGLFALLLCSGVGRQWTWFMSLFCFSAFSVASVMKGLSGEGSCGCFGVVTVNPWITTAFDVIIVILLLRFREHLTFRFKLSGLEKRKLFATIIIWLVLSVPILLTILSLKQQVHATLGTEMTASNGRKIIVLEPETWINKKFPLFDRFEQSTNSDILKQGTWTVILIHTDCPKCRKLISEKEDQAAKNIAIIDVPSPSPETLPKIPFPVFRLDKNNDWFAATPCIIGLSDGICVSVNENP